MKWIVSYQVIKLNDPMPKESSRILYVTVSSVVLPFSHCLSLLPGLLSYACTMDVKKLRVISPLLIVLISRGGNHWVLVNLPFIWELWLRPIRWEWGIVGVTYKLLKVWDIFVPPPLETRHLRPKSLRKRILPSSYLS